MRPVPESDEHDPPGLVCDFVPSLAAVIDDVVVFLEDAIGQVVVPHELPEVFDGVSSGDLGGNGSRVMLSGRSKALVVCQPA